MCTARRLAHGGTLRLVLLPGLPLLNCAVTGLAAALMAAMLALCVRAFGGKLSPPGAQAAVQ
jgi:hypothetical protein